MTSRDPASKMEKDYGASVADAPETPQYRKFDPPKAVVSPALGELFIRLRRAGQLPDLEGRMAPVDRKIFEEGFQARRKVLEHTALLTFGQWALYMARIRSAGRNLRLAYGVSATVITTKYVQLRATEVTETMFEKIVAQPGDSPVGNEARVILAHLEGPDGPYYSSVMSQDMRMRLIDEARMGNTADSAEGTHPQFNLQPRVLTDPQNTPSRPGDPGRPRPRGFSTPPGDRPPMSADAPQPIYVPKVDPPETSDEADSRPSSPPFRDPAMHVGADRHRGTSNTLGVDDDLDETANGYATPFDFGAAARGTSGGENSDMENPSMGSRARDFGGFASPDRQDSAWQSDPKGQYADPGQARAAERRARRLRARGGSGNNEEAKSSSEPGRFY